jgi:hypothetical protein
LGIVGCLKAYGKRPEPDITAYGSPAVRRPKNKYTNYVIGVLISIKFHDIEIYLISLDLYNSVVLLKGLMCVHSNDKKQKEAKILFICSFLEVAFM